jgi:hypothetical protein
LAFKFVVLFGLCLVLDALVLLSDFFALLRLQLYLNHPIVRFAYLCHMISEELVFLSFLYIKLFERVVEVVFNKSIVSSSAERGRVV